MMKRDSQEINAIQAGKHDNVLPSTQQNLYDKDKKTTKL